jgi:hypothetical protein
LACVSFCFIVFLEIPKRKMAASGNNRSTNSASTDVVHNDSNADGASSVSDETEQHSMDDGNNNEKDDDADGVNRTNQVPGTESPVVVSPMVSPSLGGMLDQEETVFWDADQGKRGKPATESSLSSPPQLPSSSSMMMIQNSPPPFWKTGFQRKASPSEVQPWATLSMTLDGRDKITKTLQYASRFLGWYLAGRNLGDGGNLSQRFLSLYKSLAASRKAFRLGRSFVELQKLRTMGLGEVLSQVWGTEKQKSNSSSTTTELWNTIGTAVKTLGLCGFWAGDNVSYLSSSGFLDNHGLSDKERAARRNGLATLASERATQAYFLGSLAGLFVAWKSYWGYQWDKLQPARTAVREAKEEQEKEMALQTLTNLQEKEVTLFVTLLKVRLRRVWRACLLQAVAMPVIFNFSVRRGSCSQALFLSIVFHEIICTRAVVTSLYSATIQELICTKSGEGRKITKGFTACAASSRRGQFFTTHSLRQKNSLGMRLMMPELGIPSDSLFKIRRLFKSFICNCTLIGWK